ncbi:MAG: 4Fe-4S dicluster domain-containing protein [Lachnospiraceae bacterium]
MNINELKSALQEAGVVGAGGAGFPTYAKLSEDADTVLLNAAECEPLTKVDRQLLIQNVREILGGMQLLVETLGANEGIIAVKKSYTASIDAISACIGEYQKLRIHILPDVYPAGDEVVLIYEATGRVVPQGKIPIVVGCVVVNVETALNVYRKVFEQKNVTTKFVTVAGLVRQPLTAEVPVGVTVADMIALAGGTTDDDYAIIMGGPMTGRIVTESELVTKTTKAILVLPPSCPPVAKRRMTTKFNIRNAMSVCSQCSMCTSLCPRHLLGGAIQPHEFMRALANGLTSGDSVNTYLNSFFCVSCGLCEMYSCHQSLSPRSLLDQYKGGLRQAGVKPPERPMKPVDPMREERKVPEHRLVHRLGLAPFDVPAPLSRHTDFESVTLSLRQSIGAPCVPCVKKGEQVSAGQLIGQPPEGALGVCLHASISGTVTDVTDQAIMIRS